MLKKFIPERPEFSLQEAITAIFQEHPEILEILLLRIELEPEWAEHIFDTMVVLVDKLYSNGEYDVAMEKRVLLGILESHKKFITNLQTTYAQNLKDERETNSKLQDLEEIDSLLSSL